MTSNHVWVRGNSLPYMREMTDQSVDMVLADPPYDDQSLINASIHEARRVSRGASLYFMYAENLCDLVDKPDQVLFWVKAVSTKNTLKRYSRFVEVVCVYDLARGCYNKMHWSSHTGVYTDQLIEAKVHEFQKPVALLERFLRIHMSGGVVLDPFAGSGSVRRAARRIGYDSISIEIT